MIFTKGDTVVHRYDNLKYKQIYFVNKVDLLFLDESYSPKFYFSRTTYFNMYKDKDKDSINSLYLANNYKTHKSLLIEKTLIWD